MATFIAKTNDSQIGNCPCFMGTDDDTGDLVIVGTELSVDELAIYTAEAAANDSAIANHEHAVRIPADLVHKIAGYVLERSEGTS